MLIPDVVVAERAAVLADRLGILDSTVVALVAEIVSPGSATMDRLTNPALFAGSGIGSYWRIESGEGPEVHVYRLDAGRYVETSAARPGEILTVDTPVSLSLDPAELLP